MQLCAEVFISCRCSYFLNVTEYIPFYVETFQYPYHLITKEGYSTLQTDRAINDLQTYADYIALYQITHPRNLIERCTVRYYFCKKYFWRMSDQRSSYMLSNCTGKTIDYFSLNGTH